MTPFQIRRPELLQQEDAAVDQMDRQAGEQDFIAKQQRDNARMQAAQEEAAREAARAQKAALANAKRQGVKVAPDATGAETIQRHPDGAPVYEAGFIGEPQINDKGGAVAYRDARGQRYDVPFDAIRSEPDPSGETFYSFDVSGPDGTKQTMRQPAGSKPLFRVDPGTGQRIVDVTDPATGSVQPRIVGVDPLVANKAAIEKRKNAAQLAQNERSGTAEELRLQLAQKNTLLQPVAEKLKAAQDAADKLAKARTSYEQAADGFYAVTTLGDGVEPMRRKVDAPQEIATADSWVKNRAATEKALMEAKAEYEPAAAEIQTMQERRDALALETLRENRRMQAEIRRMEEAAKAGKDVTKPDWQKRAESLAADPRMSDLATVADMEAAGDPLAPDVQAAALPETAKMFQRVWSAGFQGQPKSLLQGMLDGVTAMNPGQKPQSTAEAQQLAAKSLGISDPASVSIEANPLGHFELRFGDDEFASYSPANNRITIIATAAGLNERAAELIANADKDGVPVYLSNSYPNEAGQPFNSAELRGLMADGLAAVQSADTQEVAESSLAAAGLSPDDIRGMVRSGKLSVQDGRMMLDKFHGVEAVNYSRPAIEQELGRVLSTSATAKADWEAGNKAGVINRVMDQVASKATSGVVVDRAILEQRRQELLAQDVKEGAVSKVGGFLKELIMPMIGIGGQAAAYVPQKLAKWSGYETEAGRLSEQQWEEWQKRTGSFIQKMQSRGDVLNSLNDLKAWAQTANPGDTPPDDLAEKIAGTAYDGYHELTDDAAKALNTSRDTFNINRDPMLRAAMSRYLTTADPAVFEQLSSLLMLDGQDRKTQAEVSAYISAPRVATPADVVGRAKGLGIDLTPEKANALMGLTKRLESADDKAAQGIITQAGKILGLEGPEAAETFARITADETDDPESAWGLLKGGFIAGRQELVTEIASTAAEAGLAWVTAGAATPEIMAERAARQGVKTGIRAAIRRQSQAAFTKLADSSTAFAKTAAALGKARETVGTGLANMGEAFAKAGVKPATFGQPLTRADKARNALVQVGKNAAAAAPMEAIEEGIAAIGEPDPNAASIGEQMLMGAAGGLVLTPMFAGAAAVGQAWKNRGAGAEWEKRKAGYIDELNRRMESVPGFKPLTVADFDAWQGLQDNPAHTQARAAYQSALATFEQELALHQDAAARNASLPLTPELLAARVQLDTAAKELELATSSAFMAMDELRGIPEAERPLYTAAAKAATGARDFTEAEAKALMAQGGNNAVVFQQAQAMPADVAGPPSQRVVSAPAVSTVAPGVYRLPAGVRVDVPPALLDSLVQKAPTMVDLLRQPANQTPAVQAVVAKTDAKKQATQKAPKGKKTKNTAPPSREKAIQSRLSEIESQFGPRDTVTFGKDGKPETKPYRIATTEEQALLDELKQMQGEVQPPAQATPAETQAAAELSAQAPAMKALPKVAKKRSKLLATLKAKGVVVRVVNTAAEAEAVLGKKVSKGRKGVAQNVNGVPHVVLIGEQTENAMTDTLDHEAIHGLSLAFAAENPELHAAAMLAVDPASPEFDAALDEFMRREYNGYDKLSQRQKFEEALRAIVEGRWKGRTSAKSKGFKKFLKAFLAYVRSLMDGSQNAALKQIVANIETALQNEPNNQTPGATAGVTPTPTGQTGEGAVAPAAVPKPTLPAKAIEKVTREAIGRIAAKSPRIKALLKESKEVHRYPTGGMWLEPDGTVMYHVPTIVQQLESIGVTDNATAGKRVEALLDEEIRHSANMEAARRLFAGEQAAGRVLRGMSFETWRDAWYGDIWNSHFTDAMRQAVQEAYGDTLPEQDWMRAIEGLRMLDQLRATGSITEAVLLALDAILESLREFLDLVTAGGKQVVEAEIMAIREVLAEYGYEGGTVKPNAKKKPAKVKAQKQEAAQTSKPVDSAPEMSTAQQKLPILTVSDAVSIKVASDPVDLIVRADAKGMVKISETGFGNAQTGERQRNITFEFRTADGMRRVTFRDDGPRDPERVAAGKQPAYRFSPVLDQTSQAIPPATTPNANEEVQTEAQAEGQGQEVLTPAPEAAPAQGAADGLPPVEKAAPGSPDLAQPTIPADKHWLFDTQGGDVAAMTEGRNVFIVAHFTKLKDAKETLEKINQGKDGPARIEAWLAKPKKEGGKVISKWAVFIPNVTQDFVDEFNAIKARDQAPKQAPLPAENISTLRDALRQLRRWKQDEGFGSGYEQAIDNYERGTWTLQDSRPPAETLAALEAAVVSARQFWIVQNTQYIEAQNAELARALAANAAVADVLNNPRNDAQNLRIYLADQIKKTLANDLRAKLDSDPRFGLFYDFTQGRIADDAWLDLMANRVKEQFGAPAASQPSFKVGDRVQANEGTGKIAELRGGQAKLTLDNGTMSLWIPVDRLQAVQEPVSPETPSGRFSARAKEEARQQFEGLFSSPVKVDKSTSGGQSSPYEPGIDSPAQLASYDELPDTALDREELAALTALRERFGSGVLAARPRQPLLAPSQTPREKESRRGALSGFQQLSEDLRAVFGKRVLFVKRRGKPLPDNGYNVGTSRNVLAVDIDAVEPVNYLVGHELGHAIEAQSSDLYRELSVALLEMAGDTTSYRARLTALGYKESELDAEIVNDFIGSQFMEPAFWRDLAGRDKSLFERMADAAVSFIQSILRKASILSRDVRPLFAEIDKARALLVEVLTAYATDAKFPQMGALAGELSRSASGMKQQAIPADRLPGFIKLAQTLIAEGIRAPQDLAAFLEETFPGGKARPFSQALWNAVGMVSPDLSSTPDWTRIYGDIDQPLPDVQEPEAPSRDTSHLDAIIERLTRERQRLDEATTDQDRAFRQRQIAQAERELAAEYEFLGINPPQSDADILAALEPEAETPPTANLGAILAKMREVQSYVAMLQTSNLASDPNRQSKLTAEVALDGALLAVATGSIPQARAELQRASDALFSQWPTAAELVDDVIAILEPAVAETPVALTETARLTSEIANEVSKLATGDVDIAAIRARYPDMSAKAFDEAVELGITMAARQIAQEYDTTGLTPAQAAEFRLEAYNRLRALHNRQPKLTAKTSSSKINQAYSTPAPMAYLADVLADAGPNAIIAEPSAGNGMLLIARQPGQTILANELDPARRERLAMQGIEATGEDATTWTPAQAPDRVIANPPFGQIMQEGGGNKVFQTPMGETTSIDHAIVLQSLATMKPGGRAVFIIGGPPPTVRTDDGRMAYYRGGKAGKFFGHLYGNHRVIDHFTVSGDLYEKQGAGWPLDILVISGEGKSPNALPGLKAPRQINTWEELANELNRTDAARLELNRLTEEQMRDRVDAMAGKLEGLSGGLRGDAGTSRPARDGTGSTQSGTRAADRGRVPANDRQVGSGNQEPVSPDATGDVVPPTPGDVASNESGAGQLRPREVEATAFQAPFPATSGVNPAGLLAPVNLIGPMSEAMQRLKEQVGGDLVSYVRDRLGYPAGTNVAQYFFGDQIDAIAQAIHTAENGGALVIGDQTGTGKGRIAAGLIKYAVRRGIVPVFVTKNQDLYDAMLDDLQDIGAPEVVPLITNEKIEEKSLRQKLRDLGADQGQAAFENVTGEALPGNANVIFTTYDQIRSDDAKGISKSERARAKRDMEAPPGSWRMAALRRVAPNAMFILDESHLAGGQSTTGWRFAELLGVAKHAYYSSATFAKRPDNMGIYFRTNLGRVGGDINGLIGLMQAGGVPAMQIGSSMLAQDGQYMRRERSFDGVTFQTVISQETYERDRELADNYTRGLRAIIGVQERMSQAAEIVNTILSSFGKSAKIPVGNRARLESANFSAKLHNLVRQYLLAIKANGAAQLAVRAIQQGVTASDGTVKPHKVIVAVENTMESIIEELEVQGLPMNFNGVLRMYLNQMRRIKVSGGAYGREAKYFILEDNAPAEFANMNDRQLRNMLVINAENPETGEAAYEVNQDAANEMIRRAMMGVFREAQDILEDIQLADMPVSPIDAMRQIVERAGIKTGEMTGRTTGIDKNGQPYQRNASEVKGKLKAKDDFNNSNLDFLVINKSGSTGVSMHASEKFKDKRPRLMLVVQANLDINEFMQTIGRIHRAGQVELPSYMNVQSALPAEKRPAAILGRKMAMLNANTTSNADSELSQKEVADIFNQYGDEVVHRYLSRNPGLVRMIGQSWEKLLDTNGNLKPLQDFQSEEDGGEYGYLSRSVTGHLAILPVDEQEVFWDQVSEDYQGLIDYLDQIGKNELRASVLDLKAETVTSEVFTPGSEEGSVFGRPSYIESVKARMGRKPLEVDEALQLANAAKETAETRQDQFLETANAYIDAEEQRKAVVSRNWNERRQEWLSQQQEQRDTISNAMGQIGNFGTYERDDASEGYAFIEDVQFNAEKPNTPSAHFAIVRVNDSQDRLKLPVSQFQEFFKPSAMSSFNRDRMAREAWQRSWSYTTDQFIVTGNLLAALQELRAREVRARVISYTKDDGSSQMGILLSKKAAEDIQGTRQTTQGIQSADQMLEAVRAGYTVKNSAGNVRFAAQDGQYFLYVPSARSTGGKYWRDPALLRITGEFDESSGRDTFSATMDADAARRAFEYLVNTHSERFARPVDSGTLSSAPARRLGRGLADLMPARPQTGPLAMPNIAKAYRAVQQGQSSVMVPIRAVFQRMKSATPEITPAQFMAEIQAADERGDIMVEAPERPETLQQAGPFVVRNALGVPSTNMMVVDDDRGGDTGGDRPQSPLASAPVRSVTPAQDAEYMAAVEAGDMEKAQAMVDAAKFSASPPSRDPISGKERIGDALSKQREDDQIIQVGNYAAFRFRDDGNGVFVGRSLGSLKRWAGLEALSRAAKQAIKEGKVLAVAPTFDSEDFYLSLGGKFKAVPKYPGRIGFVGDSLKELAAKSADPVTYDEDGNVIPLSQRFNPEAPSILYAAPIDTTQSNDPDAEYLAAVEAGDMETAQRLVDAALNNVIESLPVSDNENDIPNTRSISSSLSDWEERGVREVPVEYLVDKTGEKFPNYMAGGIDRTRGLADRIENEGITSPMILVWENEKYPYVLEGNTRYDALRILASTGRQLPDSVPALIVVDKSANPVTRDQQGNVVPLSQRFNPESDSILRSAPAPKKPNRATQAMRDIIEALPPPHREVLRDLLVNGMSIADAATTHNISETAVGNILRRGEAHIRLMLDRAPTKPTVQVQDGIVKATDGRPDLAMSGNAAVAAVDQRRMTPEEVTHAEMQELATRLFDVAPAEAESLVVRWMDSGTTVLSTDSMPDSIKAIVADAQARNAAEMMMTAAAKMLVARKTLEGGNSTQLARLIYLYRNTGTEQARALGMRRDPFDTPEERAAMYLSEALLTPPDAIKNELRRNPANRDRILAAWAKRADEIKAEMLAHGIDLDATFADHAEEQKLVEETIPEPVKPALARAPKKTRQLVKAILQGMTPAEAIKAAGLSAKAAFKAYQDFRASLNQTGTEAAQAMRDQLLRSAPAPGADFAANLGLPDLTEADWLDAVKNNKPLRTTPETEKLKQHREKAKKAGTMDLKNPVSTRKAIRAIEERKSNAFAKVSEFWRASILSGPQTHVVNLVSGLTYGAYEASFKKLAAGVQGDIARMFGAKPDAASLADIPAMLAAALPSIKLAFLDSIAAWKMETRVFENYALQLRDDNGELFKEQYSPALKGKLGTVMRGISFRLMGAADEFVKSFFTRIEVAAQARQIARNEGKTGLELAQAIQELMEPGSLAWERALGQAKKITFQTEIGSGRAAIDAIDGLAQLISRTKKGDFGKPLKGLAHFTFPFVDTPTNIFKAGVTMSPVGGLLALVDMIRSYNRRRKGNIEEAAKIYNAARALDDLTNQIVAWGFIMGLSHLVKPGDDEDETPFITGTIPWRSTSPGERELAYRTAPPQSIRIGDRWISYKRLDPFASALAFTVDAIREFQSGKPIDQVWTKIALGMARNMQDKTFLQGISDVVNAVQDPERFGTKWATNIATGFIPNLIRQPIRTADDVFRETDLPNDLGFWDSLGRRMGYGIYPQGAMPAITVWGQPARKDTGTGGPNTDWMIRLLSPADMRAANVDMLDVALLRYNATHQDGDPKALFGVTAPSRELQRTIGGQVIKVSLDDAEYEDFITKSGQAARQAIGSTYDGRDLTEADVERIKDILQRTHGVYRDAAFVAAVQKRGGMNALANTTK